jgi:hypothetical protein
MTASPGWDYAQPPAPGPDRAAHDTSEPLGYDLGDAEGYQQPPPPLVRPATGYDLDPVVPSGYTWDPPSAGQSIAGFILSVTGAVSALVMPLLVAPFAVAGIAVSVTALVRCRLGRARGRAWAVAGLAVGVVEVALVLLMMRLLIAWMTTIPG